MDRTAWADAMSKMSLSVDPRYAKPKPEPKPVVATSHKSYQLFPNLTMDEMEALTADIKARGVMVPVEIDEYGALLDGHHRAMIADSLGLEYPTIVRSGWTEEEKLTHVIALNVARRHLSGIERAEIVGRLRAEGLSLRAIAGRVGVSHEEVRRDLSVVTNVTTPEVVTGTDGKAYPTERWQPASGLMSSDSMEWYTPRHILDAVVAAMGAIDLDPCAEPAKSVPAARHYTEPDDGLGRPWTGRVYMNPPYGRVIGAWVDKLGDEFDAGNVTEAVALVPARTDTSWFAHLPWTMAAFITGRLSFSDHENAAPFPSAACYLGPNADAFAKAFIGLGIVAVRLEAGG